MRTGSDSLAIAQILGKFLQGVPSRESSWARLDRSMAEVFGHRLFTVLIDDADEERLGRPYSSSPDVSSLGGANRVTDTMCSRQVLRGGQIYVSSTNEDVRSVSSEDELVWGTPVVSSGTRNITLQERS